MRNLISSEEFSRIVLGCGYEYDVNNHCYSYKSDISSDIEKNIRMRDETIPRSCDWYLKTLVEQCKTYDGKVFIRIRVLSFDVEPSANLVGIDDGKLVDILKELKTLDYKQREKFIWHLRETEYSYDSED